ncbi:MAG TPA: Ig-like domain-containing protein, partial [Candidatus Nanoarchaeia archaeon]
MQERFRPGFLIAAYVGVLFIIAAFITVGYPFFFRGSLADPSVEMDLKEGKVWLDTQIVMEFRGSHSKEALLETLEISPKVKIGEDDLKVEHIARFPWHEGFPWAKTRVTINPAKNELFAPETSYTLSIRGKVLNFETITLPKVTRSIAVNCKPQQGPAWWNDGMSTVACFEFIFNEKIVWEDRYFSVSPPTDVQLSTSDYNGKTSVFVGPSERWENSTEYTLTIKKGLKDIFGHELVEDYSNSFTTRPPSKVIEATPEGEGVPIDSVIRVKFDRHGSRNSHDLKFEIHPKVEGALEWEDGLTFVWKPKDNLSYSTGYSVVVGGISWVGDPIPEYRWRFKTEDPPVSVEIQETTHSPRALRAVASGGIGSYSYQWSTGETSDSISVDVPAGETWNISVTVSSGDQSATAEIQVKGPPLPPPIELPIGNGTGIAVGKVD